MQRSGLLATIAALVILGSLPGPLAAFEPPLPEPPQPSPSESPPAEPVRPPRYLSARRPDIVMIYLDDFAPRPRSLWSDPERTPYLARFVERGIRFDNAIVSTPLCGPSRAGLLSGRYGHVTGVVANDIGPYRADNDMAEKLGKVGYRTVYVGKHINRLAHRYRWREQMDGLSAHWDEFDVMWEDQGRFYDWLQYRKDGTYRYGVEPGDHSSRVAAERAVEHIATTPADQPLFLMLSLVDGHSPITPMQRHVDHPSCAEVAPWQGPAFNEEDVSDKPAHIRALPLLSLAHYDLVPRCEQSLTVDWVVGQVHRALRDAGRLDDTLQVLTADNGWLMGDHRIVGKGHPYATPVPLYLRWPAELGTRGRVVEDPVSNLDWLPTVCELAGCGVPHADGMSIVPLITGAADRLARRFIFVELLYDHARFPDDPRARPAYTGVETTLGYADERWAFTRYSSGEAELYNLTRDPHRLDNLYGQPGYRRVTRDLQRFHKSVKRADDVSWHPTPAFD